MKKNAMGKLKLNRETLRMLENEDLGEALGAAITTICTSCCTTGPTSACTNQLQCGNSTNTCVTEFC